MYATPTRKKIRPCFPTPALQRLTRESDKEVAKEKVVRKVSLNFKTRVRQEELKEKGKLSDKFK